MVASETKLDKERGDHKVTFTLTVALAFPTGKLYVLFKTFRIPFKILA